MSSSSTPGKPSLPLSFAPAVNEPSANFKSLNNLIAQRSVRPASASPASSTPRNTNTVTFNSMLSPARTPRPSTAKRDSHSPAPHLPTSTPLLPYTITPRTPVQSSVASEIQQQWVSKVGSLADSQPSVISAESPSQHVRPSTSMSVSHPDRPASRMSPQPFSPNRNAAPSRMSTAGSKSQSVPNESALKSMYAYPPATQLRQELSDSVQDHLSKLAVSGQIDSVRHEAEQRWWLDQSKLRNGVMSPTKTHRNTMQALQLLKPLSPQLELCFDIAGSSKLINKSLLGKHQSTSPTRALSRLASTHTHSEDDFYQSVKPPQFSFADDDEEPPFVAPGPKPSFALPHVNEEIEAADAESKERLRYNLAAIPLSSIETPSSIEELGFELGVDGLPLPWAWQKLLSDKAKATNTSRRVHGKSNLVAPSIADYTHEDDPLWPDLKERLKPPQQKLLETWVPLLISEMHEQLQATHALPHDLSQLDQSQSRGPNADIEHIWQQTSQSSDEYRSMFSHDVGLSTGLERMNLTLPTLGFGDDAHDQVMLDMSKRLGRLHAHSMLLARCFSPALPSLLDLESKCQFVTLCQMLLLERWLIAERSSRRRADLAAQLRIRELESALLDAQKCNPTKAVNLLTERNSLDQRVHELAEENVSLRSQLQLKTQQLDELQQRFASMFKAMAIQGTNEVSGLLNDLELFMSELHTSRAQTFDMWDGVGDVIQLIQKSSAEQLDSVRQETRNMLRNKFEGKCDSAVQTLLTASDIDAALNAIEVPDMNEADTQTSMLSSPSSNDLLAVVPVELTSFTSIGSLFSYSRHGELPSNAPSLLTSAFSKWSDDRALSSDALSRFVFEMINDKCDCDALSRTRAMPTKSAIKSSQLKPIIESAWFPATDTDPETDEFDQTELLHSASQSLWNFCLLHVQRQYGEQPYAHQLWSDMLLTSIKQCRFYFREALLLGRHASSPVHVTLIDFNSSISFAANMSVGGADMFGIDANKWSSIAPLIALPESPNVTRSLLFAMALHLLPHPDLRLDTGLTVAWLDLHSELLTLCRGSQYVLFSAGRQLTPFDSMRPVPLHQLYSSSSTPVPSLGEIDTSFRLHHCDPLSAVHAVRFKAGDPSVHMLSADYVLWLPLWQAILSPTTHLHRRRVGLDSFVRLISKHVVHIIDFKSMTSDEKVTMIAKRRFVALMLQHLPAFIQSIEDNTASADNSPLTDRFAAYLFSMLGTSRAFTENEFQLAADTSWLVSDTSHEVLLDSVDLSQSAVASTQGSVNASAAASATTSRRASPLPFAPQPPATPSAAGRPRRVGVLVETIVKEPLPKINLWRRLFRVMAQADQKLVDVDAVATMIEHCSLDFVVAADHIEGAVVLACQHSQLSQF